MRNSKDVRENIRTEYSLLREYHIRTIERRDSIIATTLAFAGVLLGGAIAYPTIPSIALIFPPIAVFLTIEWVNAYRLNILISQYIGYCIKPNLKGIGWEIYLKSWRDQKKGRIFAFSSGLFMSLQLLAIFIGTTIHPVPTNSGISSQNLPIISQNLAQNLALSYQEPNIWPYQVIILIIIDIFCVSISAMYLYIAIHRTPLSTEDIAKKCKEAL